MVTEEIVYLNGSLIPRSQARVSVFDHGFLYGYGLFETMRAYHGAIFLLDRHLKRLLDAAAVIGLGSKLADIDLGKACRDTLKANGLLEARLRLTVSRGEVAPFPGTSTSVTPTVLVTATGYSAMPAQVYDTGFKAGVSSFRRYSQSPLSKLKSTNYLLSVLAKMEAEAAGLDEALLLNERDFITEGSISNVFFVAHSGLITPPLESGILPGITREVVMELADTLKIQVTEGEVRLGDLGQFDEAFLTNSVMELMPLVEVRDKSGKVITIGSGKPGKITQRLISAYREMVERETAPK
ncbi:MAG: branched-chain amino acid aminotransferase [Dehalococcoidia bacterium]|nr:MAG: branched-chain amino acid aminotransferase [Dehalococcoidia bacterium]